MKQKTLKNIILIAMAAVILMMMAATVLEKMRGSDAAFSAVYHNPVFIALWAVAAVCGVISIFSRGMSKTPMTLLLHLSFVLILCGALTTFIFGKRGQVHLRYDEPCSKMLCTDGSLKDLPFTLTLTDFQVDRYSGSMAASDYRSKVEVSDGRTMEIAMNHIGRCHGYRFYQASYDPDLEGSILSVSHDPWGVGITYTGYILLLLSLLGFFFQKDTAFRRTLKKVATASLALLLFAQVSHATEAPSMAMPLTASVSIDPEGDVLPVLPKDVANEFGNLYVYYNDRVAPFQTLSRDYCLKAYGKASFHGYTAEQVVTGWLFYYDWWSAVPFKLKEKDKGTEREREKEDIRMSAACGNAFKIFPIALSDSVRAANPGVPQIYWFACDDPLPGDLSQNQWTFVRRTLDLVNDEVQNQDWDEVKRIVSKIRKYQEQTAASVLPSSRKFKAERLYNKISRPMAPFMASVTLGLLLFILAGVRISKGRKSSLTERNLLAGVSALLLVYLTIVLGLRWYVSGHAPFAGSYSVMLVMAWLSALAMLLLYRKFPLVQPLGFLLSGFTMLVASLASANPQVTHLMPVLQSPLLSIHVLSMMISYTLFGIVALNGIMGLAVPAGDPENGPRRSLMDISLVILYPAVFLLTFGTFLGAVWANVSWGSYWAWDPKETWALVTLLIYSAALHGGSIKAFRNPKFFHWFCIFAFLSVLVTYFGVNLILGGMHSYA